MKQIINKREIERINKITSIANPLGWTQQPFQHNIKMLSYKKGNKRINIYITKMTVVYNEPESNDGIQKSIKNATYRDIQNLFEKNYKKELETKPEKNLIEKNQNNTGKKHDKNKIQWALMPFDTLSQVAEVLTYGANKYEPNNWKVISDPIDRYFSAAIRHLTAFKGGEYFDNESNLPHLAHAAANIIFLMWHSVNKTTQ